LFYEYATFLSSMWLSLFFAGSAESQANVPNDPGNLRLVTFSGFPMCHKKRGPQWRPQWQENALSGEPVGGSCCPIDDPSERYCDDHPMIGFW
jgi:hypothetical protein